MIRFNSALLGLSRIHNPSCRRTLGRCSPWRASSTSSASSGRNRITSVLDIYKKKVTKEEMQYDEIQFEVVQLLDDLQCSLTFRNDVNEHAKQRQEVSVSAEGNTTKDIASGFEARLLTGGLYLCGSVGIGKTMMMDLFFDSSDIEMKRRVHFHEFMLEVHKRVHQHKKDTMLKYDKHDQRRIDHSSERFAISAVAKAISAESRLLCFDEFQVTDIADAMIMTQLFNELWDNGTVLVATSNRRPNDLYENGLNRAYFMPFIDLLKERCRTIEMKSSQDYRRQAVLDTGAFYTPIDEKSKQALYESFIQSGLKSKNDNGNSDAVPAPEDVAVPVMMGRQVHVIALGNSCYSSFHYLCETDKGPADYHAICSRYGAIFVEGIPQISVRDHNELRRFIMLVDVIYDAGVQLVWSGATAPEELFTDMFEYGSSHLKVLIESDDLTPFDLYDAAHKETSAISTTSNTKAGSPQAQFGRHVSHHSPPSANTISNLQFDGSGSNSVSSTGDDQGQKELTEALDSLKKWQTSKGTSSTFHIMKGESAAFRDLDFAVKRVISRLIEMSGKQYRNESRLKK